MRINSLELIGFKSFYEKTSIHFQSGISAIVGPNGCGKSNVLDAIRWVLGEQNPRRLRAEGMEEVVSNGSEALKPLGMAEVSVAFTGIKQFDEITVKRRLFRSGESEYYINGTPCRLKDITEMFMDTGAGARTYSTIIDQGKIEHLITAKPEDRRTIIEEVAGIVRYRVRRRETERRIESTKENLRRVKDVMDEVNRQIATLSRQARDAEEFKRITEEAKHIERGIIRSKLREVQEERKSILSQKSELQSTISSLLEIIEKKETILEDMKSKIVLVERKFEELGKEIYEIKSDLQAKEALEELRRSEASGVDELIKRLEKEIESLREECEKTALQINLKRKNLEEVNVDLSSKELDLIQKEEALSKLKSEFTKIQYEIETTRTMLFETLDKYGSLKGAALGYEKELTDLKSRRERTKKEIGEVKIEKEKTLSQISELGRILMDTEERGTQIEETKRIITSSLSTLSINQGLKKKESTVLSEGLKEVHSRLNVLKQIDMRYEWLPEGIGKFLLEKRGNEILGVIADFISVPKGYERALEAAFGERLKWVLVKESEEALRAVDSLKELSIGRGTFVPISSNGKKNGNFGKNGKDVVPLWEIIKVEEINKDVIENMLKGIFVVSSLREALNLKSEIEEGASFVTLEGDLLHSGGAISGGSNMEGVFERKREIGELTLQAQKLEVELSGILKEIDANQEEIEKLQSALGEIEKESVEIEIKEAETKKDISNLRDNLAKTQRRYEIVEFDLKGIDSEILEKETELKETLSKVRRLDNEKNLLEEKFGELKKEVQKSEEEGRALEGEVTNLRVESAALREKEKGIEEDLDELKRRQEEIKERINLESKEIEKKNQEKLSFIKTGEDTKKEIQCLLEVLGEKEEELNAVRGEKDELLAQIKTMQEEKERLKGELTEKEKNLNSFEFQLNGFETQVEHLTGIIQESGLEINQADTSRIDLSFSSESFKGLDREGEESRLRKLRERIERFGPVNLLAPEEYKNLEERFKFLNEQNEDLINALSSLRKAMNRIDRESERRFNETFEVVNKKFQEVFSRLFRGGEAKLVLINHEDLLQTGVEIMVRPSGKRFQSVSLLSGGEKALSAIALVLSACFIRPVPFLLLDEIDAPLDDVNTDQFTDLLREVTKESQIVIITHNKKTMQTANSLIGITSDKRSVSKVVSVKLGGV
jgi:chromosome segregation protein